MSVKRPVIPAELRELLDLLAALAESLPEPASMDDLGRKRDIRDGRRIRLEIHLDSLGDALKVCDLYPSVAAELLASHCRSTAETIRKELAKPLGYKVKADAAADPADPAFT